MPRRVETAKERLSIFDAEPRQQKPVDTRGILGLPERQNPVPERERKNPRMPQPQSFPRPEDAVRNIETEDVAQRQPSSPEQIRQLMDQHQQALIQIEQMLAAPESQNPQQQNQLQRQRDFYLRSLEYLKSLAPSYQNLVERGEIPVEEAITPAEGESLEDVARKRKDVAEFADTKEPEAAPTSQPEEVLNRRISDLPPEIAQQIRSIYTNDAALVDDKESVPQRAFQWQKNEQGEWVVRNTVEAEAKRENPDRRQQRLDLIRNTMKVVDFFAKNPTLWRDEYGAVALQTQNGIGTLVNLINAMTRKEDSSVSEPMYMDDSAGVPMLGEEPQEEATYDPAGADELTPDQIAEQEATGLSPEDSESAEAVKSVADGSESVQEEDMLIEEADKFEPKNRDGSPKLKLDEVSRFVPSMEMPSAKNIENEILRAASVEGATIGGKPVSEYVETDEEGNVVGLSREGRALRRDLMRGDLFDYFESLIYREPQFDENGNQIPDPVTDLVRKSLYYNAYKIDPRSIDADPQKTLDGMANLVLYDVMNAIDEKKPQSLFLRWPSIEKRGTERGQSLEEAVARWLASQAFGTRLRVNRHYSRPRYTDQYRKWMNARRTVAEIANAENPIPQGATKEQADAIRRVRKDQVSNWVNNNPEPSERYIGVSSMEGFFENMQPDEALDVVQDWSGEVPTDPDAPEARDFDAETELDAVRERLTDKPKSLAFLDFLIAAARENPGLLRLEEQNVESKPEAQWNQEFEAYQNSPEYQQRVQAALLKWESNNLRPTEKAALEAWETKKARQAELIKRQLNNVYRDINPKPTSAPINGIEIADWNKVTNLWNAQNPESKANRAALKKQFDRIKKLFNETQQEEPEVETDTGEEPKADISAPGTPSFPFGDKDTLAPETVPLKDFDSLRQQMGIQSNMRKRVASLRSLLRRKK